MMWGQRQSDYGHGREGNSFKHYQGRQPYNQGSGEYASAGGGTGDSVQQYGSAPPYGGQQQPPQPQQSFGAGYSQQMPPANSSRDVIQQALALLRQQQQQPVSSAMPPHQQPNAQALLMALLQQQQQQAGAFGAAYHDRGSVPPQEGYSRNRESFDRTMDRGGGSTHWIDRVPGPPGLVDHRSLHHSADPRTGALSARGGYPLPRQSTHDSYPPRGTEHLNRDDYFSKSDNRESRNRNRRDDHRTSSNASNKFDRNVSGGGAHRRNPSSPSSAQTQISSQRTPVIYPRPSPNAPAPSSVSSAPSTTNQDRPSQKESQPAHHPADSNSIKPGTARKYVTKISSHLLTATTWEYSEMKKRFSQMFLSSFVSRIVLPWTVQLPEIPMTIKAPIKITSLPSPTKKPVKPSPVTTLTPRSDVPSRDDDSIQYWVKVMLVSGVPFNTEFDSIVSPQSHMIPASSLDKDDSIIHFTQLFKCLVVRRQRNRLCAFGGLHDPSVDGDPLDDQSLINCAIRVVKDQLELDLSGCTRWIKFMEVHYSRVDASVNDISVYFIPSIWDILPDLETSVSIWKEKKLEKIKLGQLHLIDELLQKKQELSSKITLAEQDPPPDAPQPSEDTVESLKQQLSQLETSIEQAQEELSNLSFDCLKKQPPTSPQFLATIRGAKTKDYKLSLVSLETLLDYSFEYDREEDVMELSLFAESFWNYLQRHFGLMVYEALANSLRSINEKDESKHRGKRPRDPSSSPSKEDAKDDDADDHSSKKTKPDETDDSISPVSVVPSEQDTPASEPSERPSTPPPSPPPTEEPAPSSPPDDHPPTSKTVNLELLRAFHFFDRNRTGYIRAEDLEHLLYSLGLGLSRHYVTDLILKADSSNSVSQRFERKRKICYESFVTKQSTPL